MKLKMNSITRIAMMTALLAICSWITIPFAVPFTMQTFAVFLALIICGGVEGSIAIAVYIAIGAVGIPVFSGFSGGVSALIGPTGGYIFGFLLSGGVKILFEKIFGREKLLPVSLLAGLLVCYLCGTVYFTLIMNGRGGSYTLWSALMVCVVPFIIPDIIKLCLAILIGRKLPKK